MKNRAELLNELSIEAAKMSDAQLSRLVESACMIQVLHPEPDPDEDRREDTRTPYEIAAERCPPRE